MKVLAGVLLVLFMAGCSSGSSTSGVTSIAAPSGTQASIGRTLALRHTPHPGRVVRWSSHIIPVNIKTPWAIQAGAMLAPTGLKFQFGKNGGIKFGGYSKARNSVGWAKFSYRGGKIYRCTIYLNPRYLRRYSASKTFAHELLHCAGINGHFGNGLMNSHGGNGVLSGDAVALIKYLYSRRPGSKL